MEGGEGGSWTQGVGVGGENRLGEEHRKEDKLSKIKASSQSTHTLVKDTCEHQALRRHQLLFELSSSLHQRVCQVKNNHLTDKVGMIGQSCQTDFQLSVESKVIS